MLELGWLTAFGEKAIERVVDRMEQLTGRNVDRASPIGMRIARIEAELRILLRACRVDVEVTRANVLALRGQRRVGPQRLIQILLQRRIIGTRQRRQAQQDWQHKTFHARRRPAVVAGRRPRSASSMALCSSWPDDKPASSRKAPLVCATWMAPCVKLHRVIASNMGWRVRRIEPSRMPTRSAAIVTSCTAAPASMTARSLEPGATVSGWCASKRDSVAKYNGCCSAKRM